MTTKMLLIKSVMSTIFKCFPQTFSSLNCGYEIKQCMLHVIILIEILAHQLQQTETSVFDITIQEIVPPIHF